MPAADRNDLPAEVDPHRTGTAQLICFPCVNGLHTKCRQVTDDVWCECPLESWLWPDGQPDRFWTRSLRLP